MGNGNSLRRISAAEKRAEVVRRRGLGESWSAIASMVGYSDASHAIRAFNQAVSEIPEPDVAAIRSEERIKLEAMDAELARIIAHPQPALTAAGKTVIGPDGDIVLDQSVMVRAIAERRKIGESLRKMCGADRPYVMPRNEARESIDEWLVQIDRDAALAREARAVDAEVVSPRAIDPPAIGQADAGSWEPRTSTSGHLRYNPLADG